MAVWKLAPALATGCTVVLKPSELTSLSALKLAEYATRAGIPAGVLNVVPGVGEEAGKALGLHPNVAVLAFTGSVEVGRFFMQYSAASNLKKVTLELGGKSPQVILSDVTAAQIPELVPHILNAAFWNMGENCSCGSRLIVPAALHDELVQALVAAVEGYVIGDPADPSTQVGALIEKPHFEKVLGWIERARADGAVVACGGAAATEGALGQGYFVKPTILVKCTNDMAVAREEVFGPVLSVIAVASDAEALAAANDSAYGLAASLYTNNLSKAHRGARHIKAGTVSVNCFSEGNEATPFGGFKLSGGNGSDKSVFAHQNYTHTKTIWMKV